MPTFMHTTDCGQGSYCSVAKNLELNKLKLAKTQYFAKKVGAQIHSQGQLFWGFSEAHKSVLIPLNPCKLCFKICFKTFSIQ